MPAAAVAASGALAVPQLAQLSALIQSLWVAPILSGVHALFVARKLRAALEGASAASAASAARSPSGKSAPSAPIRVAWPVYLLFSFLCTVGGGTTVALLAGGTMPLFSGDLIPLQVVLSFFLVNYAWGLSSVTRRLLGIGATLDTVVHPTLLALLAALEACNRSKSILRGASVAGSYFAGSLTAAIVLVIVAGCMGGFAFSLFERVCLRKDAGRDDVPPAVLLELTRPGWGSHSAFWIAVWLIACGGSSIIPAIPWGALVERATAEGAVVAALGCHGLLAGLWGPFDPLDQISGTALMALGLGDGDVVASSTTKSLRRSRTGSRARSPASKKNR